MVFWWSFRIIHRLCGIEPPIFFHIIYKSSYIIILPLMLYAVEKEPSLSCLQFIIIPSLFFFWLLFHFVQVDGQKVSNLSFLPIIFPFYFLPALCSHIWLNQLVLGHPICLFAFNFNSDVLVSNFFLIQYFTWPSAYNNFSSNYILIKVEWLLSL